LSLSLGGLGQRSIVAAKI